MRHEGFAGKVSVERAERRGRALRRAQAVRGTERDEPGCAARAGAEAFGLAKGSDDEAPLLLGEVEAKAEAYAGDLFGAAYVLVDDPYVDFACGRDAGG
jgi:hypothetical protein